MSHLVAPSLLAANFLHLESELEMLHKTKADWLHMDVMDGNFVPNISFGSNIIHQMAGISNLPLDVHLMIDNPDQHIPAFIKAGADYVLLPHFSAGRHFARVVAGDPYLRSLNSMKQGDIERLREIIYDL